MKRRRKKRSRVPIYILLVVVVIGLGLGSGVLLGKIMRGAGFSIVGGKIERPSGETVSASAAQSVPGPESGNTSGEITPRDYAALPLPDEMRAMWISFLEWLEVDLTTEESARAVITAMFDDCVEMGINTVIVHVRPFGDALYPSSVYPWSHIITDTQGYGPEYDPLRLMVDEGHKRGLRVEAWINPYRVRTNKHGPNLLSADNPATQHPEWVRDVSGLVMYNPCVPEVQQLVVDGVLEIVQNYDVDGIHFDDYFYPEFPTAEADAAFDAEDYAAYGGELSLGDWRRENVNTLVRRVYEAVKAANPTASFGISPQGNNENNYTMQYSDVKLWMASGGYVDYVMPQIYWGFGHLDGAGKDTAAFAKKADEWAFYPRVDGVRLYAGLGAHCVGAGDSGVGDQAEWYTGHNLADQVEHLRTVNGFSGFALYRYGMLFTGEAADPALSAQEVAALAGLLDGAGGAG